MKTLLRTAIILTLLSTSPSNAGWWWSGPEPEPPKKIDLSNIRDVVTQLMPLTSGVHYTDVSVFGWGDGSVNIHVKTRRGTEIRGSGDSVAAALPSMIRSASDVSQALAPLLPTQ